MAFTVTFYKISDPPNKLVKNLGTAIKTSNCTPFRPVSDLTGTILIDYAAAAESANYAMVTGDGRNRYCFITDIEKDIGGKMSISLREDALMTFSNAIYECGILATRSSVIAKNGGNVGYNSYLEDGMWRCDATNLYWLSEDLFGGYFDYTDRNAGGAMDEQWFIIATAG